MHDALTIAGRDFGSRLIVGTGKYDSFATMRDAVVASGCEMVTVAVRRIDLDAAERLLAGAPDCYDGGALDSTPPVRSRRSASLR